MRFGVPRSVSPSPVRKSKSRARRSSTYGLQSDSSSNESEFTEGSSSETESDVSTSSTDSFMYGTEADVPPPAQHPRRSRLTLSQRNYVEDTVAAIRLRTRHHDPYEEWEKETRKDAFHSARRQQAAMRAQQAQALAEARRRDAQRQADASARELEQVAARLAGLELERKREGQMLAEQWKAQGGWLRERVERVIEEEEAKVRVQLERERKAQEEEERKRREAEEKVRLEEQRVKAEEEKKKLAAEEERKQKQREEEEKRKQDEIERLREEQLQKEQEERKALGMSTPEEDWKEARQTLKRLKAGPMAAVKGNKDLKKFWNEQRRKITPKVGQLTNDEQAINTISQQILEVFKPSPPLPPDVYHALLSSLSKAILLQAETEVTAEKRSAGPLARMTVNLMGVLDDFEGVFWAKLVQRTGGWPVPASVPDTDVDGTPFLAPGRAKAEGVREDEGAADYAARVAGIMRVYFAVLHAPAGAPRTRHFQRPRFWAYFARMLAQPRLCAAPLAAELLSIALDEGGAQARAVWGQQWVKLMALLYEGLTQGVGGTSRRIGGDSPDGRAAQVRAQLEVERVMAGAK